MKKLIDKYPIGTYLTVRYQGEMFKGTVTEKRSAVFYSDNDINIDIIPDIELNHGRYREYGVHSIRERDIIKVIRLASKSCFDDSLFEV